MPGADCLNVVDKLIGGTTALTPEKKGKNRHKIEIKNEFEGKKEKIQFIYRLFHCSGFCPL